MEKAFSEAIDTRRIEGVVLAGYSLTGHYYNKCLGSRTKLTGSTAVLTTSDILFLASATKLLTTVAVLQCCERGFLNLDDDLKDLFPMIGRQQVLAEDNRPDGIPFTEPLRKALTLRHLLTHSSGMVYEAFFPIMQRWRAAHPLPQHSSPGVPEQFDQPLAFTPGTQWMYGTGLDWVGFIVEQVTAMPLDSYFRREILHPLGIPPTDLSFFPVKEGMGERMPDLNPKDPLGEGLSTAMGTNIHPKGSDSCFGGQGAYATSDTYLALLKSILANDGKLLSNQSTQEMFAGQLEPQAKDSLREVLSGPTGAFWAQSTSGRSCDFGLGGLLVGVNGDGGMSSGTMTWGGGVNSTWLIDRNRGICGFVSLQLGLPPSYEMAQTLKAVFKNGLAERLATLESNDKSY